MKKLLFLTTTAIILCMLGFTLYLNNKNSGSITVTHEQTEMMHIVSIRANDLKVPFFGLAFHLVFDDFAYEFDHYTLGEYFEADDEPLVLVEEDPDFPEIIAGVSMIRGKIIDKPEGDMLKLYFNKIEYQPDVYGFELSDCYFSTYDKGRKDITDIHFNAVDFS